MPMHPITYVSFAEEHIRELLAEAERGRLAARVPPVSINRLGRIRAFLAGRGVELSARPASAAASQRR